MEKNKKIIAGIAGAVALIAIVAVCIFAFGSGKEKKITENIHNILHSGFAHIPT